MPSPVLLVLISSSSFTQNSYTERSIAALRQISILNNYLVELPIALANLQSSLRAKTSFSHIQRLHNMLYAYGATVVEIVRRKEFGEWFRDGIDHLRLLSHTQVNSSTRGHRAYWKLWLKSRELLYAISEQDSPLKLYQSE